MGIPANHRAGLLIFSERKVSLLVVLGDAVTPKTSHVTTVKGESWHCPSVQATRDAPERRFTDAVQSRRREAISRFSSGLRHGLPLPVAVVRPRENHHVKPSKQGEVPG